MENNYLETRRLNSYPRIPLNGKIDITYRCNNNCLHCWLRKPEDYPGKLKELSFLEFKKIIDHAKESGCREWNISGGEPMLRKDFIDIFDYATRNNTSYTLNTNGTLITQKIAQYLKKKGSKFISVYGATAKIHDHITQVPGSFECTMRGISYLKEAGAGFYIQLILMKDNLHQKNQMISLARELSDSWRFGASWLHLSDNGSSGKNQQIISQRLSAEKVVQLSPPSVKPSNLDEQNNGHFFFSNCINKNQEFHIDPYGQMTFCGFIKDPSLCFDLTKGNFKEAWDIFLPSLSNKIKPDKEYLENCHLCEIREDCVWCPALSYLEKRRFSAKADYFCSLAKERHKFRKKWKENHQRYFNLAEIDILLESDLPIHDDMFPEKFSHFRRDKIGKDPATIHHHFSFPDPLPRSFGKEVFKNPPWAIFQMKDSWVYTGISTNENNKDILKLAVFNQNHTKVQIFNASDDFVNTYGFPTLTLFPSDMIVISQILADNQGFCLHSSGIIFREKGLLFAGHSGAGKSTILKLLGDQSEILCDDRMILRKKNSKEFWIYGTWSHGEIPVVSSKGLPLEAIFLLKKSKHTKIIKIENKLSLISDLLSLIIKPMLTKDWWNKTLPLAEDLLKKVPFYYLYFDKSRKAQEVLEKFCDSSNSTKLSEVTEDPIV